MKYKFSFAVIVLLLIGLSSEAQSKHKYDGIWWDIADQCFIQASLSESSTLFIDVNNTHSAGSIYKRRLNNTGRMLHPILLFDYTQVASNIAGFPTVENKILPASQAFSLESGKVYQADVVGKIVSLSGIAKISKDLSALLSQQTALTISFQDWGIESIDKYAIEESLKANKKLDFVKETRDGERYIVSQAVWIKSLAISYSFNEAQSAEIVNLFKANELALQQNGIVLSGSKISIQYSKTYYPFLVFGEIAKMITLGKDIIFEPDFSDYNNLKRHE